MLTVSPIRSLEAIGTLEELRDLQNSETQF